MTLKYENKKIKQGYTHVIGCDEVGRGSLAGPVVAAAVLLPVVSSKQQVLWAGIKDSKLLSAQKRQELDGLIRTHAVAWGIGQVSSNIVDEINIHQATLLAMRWAVENLFSVMSGKSSEPSKPFLFIDGKFTVPGFHLEQQAVVEADNKIISVAAASIIAKVYRDNLMCSLHADYPVYGLSQHKGYGTMFHRTMILQHGLSPIHRRSFCGHLVLSA